MGFARELDYVKKAQKEILLLARTGALLGWDQQTHMPKKGIEARSEQSALIDKLVHERMISDELFKVVKKLLKENLEKDDKIMIEKLYKDISRSRKLPPEFVEELSKACSKGFSAWIEAREKNDFKIFEPHLEKIVELKKKQAKYIDLPGHAYNSLLDNFEEGMTAEKLKPRFEILKKGILDLLNKIENSSEYKMQNIVLMKRDFPKELQIELAKDVAERIGLDKERSDIDFAEHPFTTTIDVNDVRITTNVRKDALFCFGSTMHEAGHALYELQLPEEHRFDVLGDAPSLGAHESQSRFWELMIGKNKPFWKYYFPIWNKDFHLRNDFPQWMKEVNKIEKGMIRIESDEVHYCLHIILRFEIELGLISGEIKVKDLPRIWNDKMKEFFGVMPKSDKEGVLQDVHWSGGSIGYFPTYALGTIYASQLYSALKKQIPDIEKDIERGNFSRIREWLKENVHKHGRKMFADDIIKDVCGEGLNVNVYLNYLNDKYGEIYNLK